MSCPGVTSPCWRKSKTRDSALVRLASRGSPCCDNQPELQFLTGESVRFPSVVNFWRRFSWLLLLFSNVQETVEIKVQLSYCMYKYNNTDRVDLSMNQRTEHQLGIYSYWKTRYVSNLFTYFCSAINCDQISVSALRQIRDRLANKRTPGSSRTIQLRAHVWLTYKPTHSQQI